MGTHIYSAKFFANFNEYFFEFKPQHDKTSNVTLCLEKTQISLGISSVWSEYDNSLYYMFGGKIPWFIKQIKSVILFLPRKIYFL